jgi:3-oxoacyl-[acyl-carrier-protein] synthase-3
VRPEVLAVPEPTARNGPLLRGAAVTAVGAAVPDTIVTTGEIAHRLGVTDRWIESRTGVRERRFASPGDTLAGLATEACRAALERSGTEPGEIDLVIVATCTADDAMPAAAPLVAGALGIARAAAFDVNAACTGFLSALDIATAQIESGRAGAALVVGADIMSRLLDPDDRRTAALFGDGAGAVVLTTSEPGRIGPTAMHSDAAGAPHVRAAHSAGSLTMDGHETFKAAVTSLSNVTLEALDRVGLGIGDVDLFVYHQANARILSAVGERLGLRPDRVVNAIGELGNTSAASIPLALAAADRDGRLHTDARVLLAAFGAGFTWGATTILWGAEDA